MMDLTDLPWQDIERIADITANTLQIAGAGVVVTMWVWQNRQKIANKLRPPVTPTIQLTGIPIDELVGSLTATPAIRKPSIKLQLAERALEEAVWVLPDLARQLLR